MISERLAEVYTKAEDKYFDVLDFLDSKGLPVYAYSDFFESKGVPSFVVTVALLVVLLVLITLAVTFHGPDVGQLTLSLKGPNGESLTNVHVVVTDNTGASLFDGTSSDGQKIDLKRALYSGESVSIIATLDGFQPKTISFAVDKTNTEPSLSFQKAFEGIDAKIIVADSETKTVVHEASVFVSNNEFNFQFDEDANSVYGKAGVPAGVDFLLKITADGYDEYDQTINFAAGEVKTIELSPSTAGFVGQATVQIRVEDETGAAIDDAKVTVSYKDSGVTRIADYTRQGTVTGTVDAGKQLRIVVEKEGFLKYDSDITNENITIRKKEQQIVVPIKKGGQKVHVSINDSASGFALDGAVARIYSQDGSLLYEQTADASGTDFLGLSPTDKLYFTGYKEGYLPGRVLVDVSTTDEVKLLLDKVVATNSARLDIFSIDAKANPVNGVNVLIYELSDANKLPYGIAGVTTTFAGYAQASVATGKTYVLEAATDVLSASTTVQVNQGEVDKKVFLQMQKKAQIIEMKFIDAYGRDVNGTATVEGLDGVALFSGPLTGSEVFFDGQQREAVAVKLNLSDGNVFSENVAVKGKDYVEVTVYTKNSAALSPVIEFVGLEDEIGEKVNGITPQAFYWAKFSVAFPKAATKAGVHFRAGSDDVQLADSQTFGLYDLSMQGATTNYSYSYSPTPEPGNETIDRTNNSSQGQKSKWIEGVVGQPNSTYVVKVKVRAEDFADTKAELQYRAWAIVGGDYYRTPADNSLDLSASTDLKQGLYAETNTQELNLFESLPECKDNICLSVNFVDDSEQVIAEKGFEALAGKTYAIEVGLSSQESDYVQLTASSDTNLQFVSTQAGSFNFVRESGASAGQNKASTAVSLAKDGKEKVRFYFAAKNEGGVKISLKAAGKTSSVSKDVLFKSVKEKDLLVELSEQQLLPGKNFTVRVADSGLRGVEGALVKIIDREGKTVKSIEGDGSADSGKNGYYRVKNDLSPGLYAAEVSAPSFASKSVPFIVALQNILSSTDTLDVKMPFGQKSSTLSAELANNSEFTIQSVSVQTEGGAGSITPSYSQTVSQGDFKLTVLSPLALGANQKQQVQITVAYTGDANDTADETINLNFSGLVEGKFLTKTTTQIHAIYNRKLDPSCLLVNPSSVSLSVIGQQGSTDSQLIDVTNNCEQALSLKKYVSEKSARSFMIVNADETIELQPGETRNVTITANNLIDRGSMQEQTFSFDLVYSSDQLKKAISVNVKTVNPLFALSYPPQITLWLAQGSAGEKAVAAQPLFVTNASSFPVDNISFSVEREYASGANVQLSIEPPGVVSLERGQSITPPKVVFAQAGSKISEPVRARIVINGRMAQLNNLAGANDRYNYYGNYYNGNNYSNNYLSNYSNTSSYYNDYYNNYNRGAYTSYNGAYSLNNYSPGSSSYYSNTSNMLGQIDVLVYYSGYNCLTAGIVSDSGGIYDYIFPDEGGQIAKRVSVSNSCAEPVRITGATPAGLAQAQLQNINPVFGISPIASSILLSVPTITVQPGQSVEVPLTIITAIPNVRRENYGVVINAVSEISQTLLTSKPFSVNIKTGSLLGEEHIKANKTKMKVCGLETQEVEVSVPKLVDASSSAPNCAEGYCDAVSAAKYLETRIRQVIRDASAAAYQKKADETSFPCQKLGVCTFEEVGLNPPTIKLYLQNDALTSALLEKQMNSQEYESVNSTPFRENLGSTGFLVEPAVTSDPNLLRQRAAFGLDKVIFLDSSISGCGYYELKISGAMKTTTEAVAVETPVLLIAPADPRNPRTSTKECEASINNLTNFTPVDKGLKPQSSYGTWLTTVDSDLTFKNIAQAVSDARFKTDERLALGSGNVLSIKSGSLSEGLAKMCISSGEKKTITVTIDPSTAKSSTSSKAFEQDVTQSIMSALNGGFGGNNCLEKTGETYSCMILRSAPGAGARQLSLNSPLLYMSKDADNKYGSCVLATVYSSQRELLDFDVRQGNRFNGISQITIIATNDDSLGPRVRSIGSQGTSSEKAAPGETLPTTDTGKQTIKKDKTAGQLSAQNGQTRISFADAATQVTATSADQAASDASQVPQLNAQGKAVRDVYYQVVYKRKGDGEETINEPVELYVNQKAQDYKYYRNIQICARPGNSNDEQTTDGAPLYVNSNDSSFVVGIVPALLKTSQPESPQTITISTGTLHPADLATDLCAKQLTAKDHYYFTITWQGDPNNIDFSQYMQALKDDGKLDNCGAPVATSQSNLLGTPSADAPRAAAVQKSFVSYIGVCSTISAACNAKTGPGGMVAGALFDCGLPAITTFKNELATSSSVARDFYNWTHDILKQLPFVPSFITEAFQLHKPLGDPRSIATYSLYGATESALRRTVVQDVAASRLLLGLNSSSIEATSTEAADLFRQVEGGKFREIFSRGTVNEASLNKVLDGFEKNLQKSLKTQLEAKRNALFATNPWRARLNPLTGGVYQGSAPKESYADIVESVLSSDETKKNLSFGNYLTQIEGGEMRMQSILGITGKNLTVDELAAKFPGNPLLQEAIIGFKSTPDSGLLSIVKGKVSAAALKPGFGQPAPETVIYTSKGEPIKLGGGGAGGATINERIIAEEVLQDLYPGADSATIRNNAISKLFAEGEGRIFSVANESQISTAAEQIEATMRRAGLTKSSAAQLQQLSVNIDQIISTTKPGVAELESLAKNRWKGILTGSLKSIGVGAVCGALSNAAGIYTYNKTLEKDLAGLTGGAVSIQAGAFTKNATYKISPEYLRGQLYKPTITEVTDPKDLRTMSAEISSGKSELLVSKPDEKHRTAEMRTLGTVPLLTSFTAAKQAPPIGELYNNDKGLFDDHLKTLRDEHVKELIYDYTATSTLSGEANKYRVAAATEDLAITLAAVGFDRGFGAQVLDEYKTKNGWLRKQLEYVLAKNGGQSNLTKQLVKDIFPSFTDKQVSTVLEVQTYWQSFVPLAGKFGAN